MQEEQQTPEIDDEDISYLDFDYEVVPYES